MATCSMARWISETMPSISRYSEEFRLHSTSSSTVRSPRLSLEAYCCPALSTVLLSPFLTQTSPSTTDTREPFRPWRTENMVPLTETSQSPVRTRSLPLPCSDARMMMFPRLRRIESPFQPPTTSNSVRSASSTSEPSLRVTTAPVSGPVLRVFP